MRKGGNAGQDDQIPSRLVRGQEGLFQGEVLPKLHLNVGQLSDRSLFKENNVLMTRPSRDALDAL